MSTETNKALVRRFYEEIDKGNLDAMDELVAEDYVDHNPPPFPGFAPGREGLKQAFRTIHRIANGKLVEKWSEKDTIRLLRQIGKMPSPKCAAARGARLVLAPA